MKAIEDFNSCWAFASAVASVASGHYDSSLKLLCSVLPCVSIVYQRYNLL